MMISQQKFEKLNLTQKTVAAKPVRRRQRQTLSCLPCRRLKVKCDRGHPCRHCRWSERADSCRYDPFPAIHAGVVVTTTISSSSSSSSSSSDEDRSSKSDASPQADSVTHKPNVVLRPKLESEISESSPAVTASSVQSEEIPTFLSNRYNGWNSKFRGSTHWLTVSRQIEYGHKTLDKHPLCQVLADVFKKINENFTATMFPGNYPFGTGYQEQAPSKNEVLSFIPDHGIVMFLVNIYMNTIERTHPMLHSPTFYEELDQFWRDPASVEDGWLAQLLVMLGLSYHMSKGVNVTPDDETTLKQYFRGAETCLKATNYLISPNLTSLRVLCMMVLARRIIAGSCLEVDACGPVMAVIFRMATGIGLNVDSQYDLTDDASVFEREIRKKLWITIVLIGACISVLVGTPLDARASDIDIPLPLNLNNDELGPSRMSFPISRPPTEFTDSTFSMIASQSFRLALDTLTHANSSSTRLSYEDVLDCSAKVKDLLMKATQIYGTAIMERADSWKSDQLFMLEIYLRRILLALHSVHGLQPNADIDYPISYWSTLESALALLVLQRQLAEDANSPESRLWLGEYYKHDFYAATMTICLIITRNDDLAMDINSNRPSKALIQLPQRETILQTLLCCRDIWARRICQTHCHFLSCLNLGSIITSLATPLPKGSNSIQVYKASFFECLRLLKNCPCGKCGTDPSSVKGSFMEHPLYQTI